jgi:dienelactone hydrolase
MSSKILDSGKLPKLQPATALWDAYRPETAPLRFAARTKDAARRWQTKTRRELAKAVNLNFLRPVKPAPRRIEVVDCGDHVREKILIQTSAHTSMPVYVLKPAGARGRLPVVVAWHGHGYGVKDIVGLWEDGAERRTPDGYHRDFGIELCRAGFLVAAPEISCFGERQSRFDDLSAGSVAANTCVHTAALSFHLGGSVVGLRVFDGMRLVDYLETRRDTDMKRLSAMGISGGGMHTMFSTCLDKRIQACVICGYYSTFRDSILAMHHCPCNYVPGLWRFGEMHDLIGLIAPRPVLIVSGDHDECFPIGAVRRGVAAARKVYSVFGTRDAVQTDLFEGRHRISGRKAYGFLTKCVGPGTSRRL